MQAAIKKHSSFVQHPLLLDNAPLAAGQGLHAALWARDPKGQPAITEQEYASFYQHIARAWDEPRYRLHFRSDAPIELKALLFVPQQNLERLGLQGVQPPGVDLYCRRVLIEAAPKDLLPDWLRFVKGVVDSEDLPLALSREKAQDAGLLRRLREVLTRRVIKLLGDEMKRDLPKYPVRGEGEGDNNNDNYDMHADMSCVMLIFTTGLLRGVRCLSEAGPLPGRGQHGWSGPPAAL